MNTADTTATEPAGATAVPAKRTAKTAAKKAVGEPATTSGKSGRESVRVAHTSDWHLGIELSGHSRRADHEKAIDSVVAQCADFAPDVIVHTGDLFDHGRPGADDQRLAAEALSRLAEIAPVVVVAGNHDPGVVLDRTWDTLATLGGASPVHFRGQIRQPDDGGIVPIAARDGNATVYVATVPFVTSHSFARFDQHGEATRRFTDGIAKVHAAYQQWLDRTVDVAHDKVVWAAHLLVGGARPGGSERIVDLGDDFATNVAHLGAVDYAAFGHIHRAQEIPGLGTGRYAGGLLPFQFHESRPDQPAKTTVLVELPWRGTPRITLAPTDTGRRLVEVEGTLDELAAMRDDVAGAFVRATVHLDGHVDSLMAAVVDALDGATVVDVRPLRPDRETISVTTDGTAATVDELLDAWLAAHGDIGDASGDRVARAAGIVRTMVGSAIGAQRHRLDGEALLDDDLAERLAADLDGIGWSDPARDAATDAGVTDAAAGSSSDADGEGDNDEDGEAVEAGDGPVEVKE